MKLKGMANTIFMTVFCLALELLYLLLCVGLTKGIPWFFSLLHTFSPMLTFIALSLSYFLFLLELLAFFFYSHIETKNIDTFTLCFLLLKLYPSLVFFVQVTALLLHEIDYIWPGQFISHSNEFSAWLYFVLYNSMDVLYSDILKVYALPLPDIVAQGLTSKNLVFAYRTLLKILVIGSIYRIVRAKFFRMDWQKVTSDSGSN